MARHIAVSGMPGVRKCRGLKISCSIRYKDGCSREVSDRDGHGKICKGWLLQTLALPRGCGEGRAT